MNPKEFVHNTAYSVQLPYIAGHSLLKTLFCKRTILSNNAVNNYIHISSALGTFMLDPPDPNHMILISTLGNFNLILMLIRQHFENCEFQT